MARRPNILRPVQLTTNLPEDIRSRLDLYLYSDVEGRVPHGKYSEFLCERIMEFFAEKRQYLTQEERQVVLRLLQHCLNEASQEWLGEADYLIANELKDKLK